MSKKVTLAMMIMCGAGIPTTYGIFRTTVTRSRQTGEEFANFHSAVEVGKVQREARATAMDYYAMAKQFETAEYPAFTWDFDYTLDDTTKAALARIRGML
jgi:hypothetical protein